MGLQFSRIWDSLFGKKEMRILMVGLDAAGKVSCIFWELFAGHLSFEFVDHNFV